MIITQVEVGRGARRRTRSAASRAVPRPGLLHCKGRRCRIAQHGPDDVVPLVHADQGIDAGHVLQQPGPVPLHEAAGHHHAAALALALAGHGSGDLLVGFSP
jgi:hypothetical protein